MNDSSCSVQDKYLSPHVVDAMRQQALGRWMHYEASPEQWEEAFGFASADAADPITGS